MKTAISLPDDVFREVDRYAKEHDYSRSEVFVIAIRELLRRRDAGKLLEALNEAYTVSEDEEEIKTRTRAKRHYARAMLKEKY